MPSAFFPNRNLASELQAESSEYAEGLAAAAKPAAEAAKGFAPIDEGDYRDGIKVLVQGQKVYLSGTDWKSGFIEFGTSDTPIFAPLRRGVRAAGLKLKESDRK